MSNVINEKNTMYPKSPDDACILSLLCECLQTAPGNWDNGHRKEWAVSCVFCEIERTSYEIHSIEQGIIKSDLVSDMPYEMFYCKENLPYTF